jgi:hypothetical protein
VKAGDLDFAGGGIGAGMQEQNSLDASEKQVLEYRTPASGETRGNLAACDWASSWYWSAGRGVCKSDCGLVVKVKKIQRLICRNLVMAKNQLILFLGSIIIIRKKTSLCSSGSTEPIGEREVEKSFMEIWWRI